jgi:hypothetical protein
MRGESELSIRLVPLSRVRGYGRTCNIPGVTARLRIGKLEEAAQFDMHGFAFLTNCYRELSLLRYLLCDL